MRRAWSAGRSGENKARPDGDGQREPEDGPVHRHVPHCRAGAQPQESLNAPARRQQPEGATGDRDQEALGHELAGEPAGGSAQGGADGELLVARRGARRQQASHVQAHDEQEHRDRRPQQHEGGQHAPAEHLLVGTDAEAVRLAQRVGIPLLEEGGEGFELCRCGLRGTVRSQPAQELVVDPDALRVRSKRKRRPDVDLGERLERGWHDADDGVRPAAQSHGSADGCPGSVEVPQPHAVAQHDGRRGQLVSFNESSTCCGALHPGPGSTPRKPAGCGRSPYRPETPASTRGCRWWRRGC